MKLNNKGFTLVEILAVVIILGILTAFMYPNVSKLIEKNKEDNYKKIENSIITATKMYLSDYRYEITVNDTNITNINGSNIIDNKIYIFTLVNEGNIITNKEGMIINPKNNEECLNLKESYIKVNYDSNKKDFIYGYSDEDLLDKREEKFYLEWIDKENSGNINHKCIATINNDIP